MRIGELWKLIVISGEAELKTRSLRRDLRPKKEDHMLSAHVAVQSNEKYAVGLGIEGPTHWHGCSKLPLQDIVARRGTYARMLEVEDLQVRSGDTVLCELEVDRQEEKGL